MAQTKAQREAQEKAEREDPALRHHANDREGLVDLVERHGSTDPEDHVTEDNPGAYAAHLTGAGTIMPGGTYGPPVSDPNVIREKDGLGPSERITRKPDADAEPADAPTE